MDDSYGLGVALQGLNGASKAGTPLFEGQPCIYVEYFVADVGQGTAAAVSGS